MSTEVSNCPSCDECFEMNEGVCCHCGRVVSAVILSVEDIRLLVDALSTIKNLHIEHSNRFQSLAIRKVHSQLAGQLEHLSGLFVTAKSVTLDFK